MGKRSLLIETYSIIFFASTICFATVSAAQTDVNSSTFAMNVVPKSSTWNNFVRKIKYCPASCSSPLDCLQCQGFTECLIPAVSYVGLCGRGN